MTSTLPDNLFDNIGDLRKKYPDDFVQSFALSRTYPAQFSIHNANHAPSYRPKDQLNFKYNLNLDAAVVVLRHLYSMVLQRQSDTITRDELSHPILRFIWADFEDESSIAAQTILRFEMQTLDDPQGKMTIFDLFERPAMWNTIWSREPFLLYHPRVLARPKNATMWKVIDHNKGVSKKSLVQWDGANDLGAKISSLFCRSSHIPTGDQFVEMFNDPAIIRVRYKHTAQHQPPATYQDLREILVAPRRIKPAENDFATLVRLSPEEDSERIRHTLVAVVRCSGQAEEADRFRLYSVTGQPMSLPITARDYVGIEWNIGDIEDPGRVYLLFYTRSLPTPITGQHGEPIARRTPDMISKIMAMKKSILLKSEEGSSASTSAPQ
ncbi:hypothetical protein F4678DRAFT_467373 [Xylaria arbuscula]|nr:hypothetical protein F4678DRAFT_467373 [Xylaria arbuscula]